MIIQTHYHDQNVSEGKNILQAYFSLNLLD
jgi:hypothetical protein